MSSISGRSDGDRVYVSSIVTTGSFDDLPMSSSSLRRSISPPHRSRLYSEEDAEIRMAKAMALAIQANPTLAPEEVRALVGAQENLQQELIRESPKNSKETIGNLIIPSRIASAFGATVKQPELPKEPLIKRNSPTFVSGTAMKAATTTVTKPSAPLSPKAKDRVKASLRGFTDKMNFKKSNKVPQSLDDDQIRLTTIVWKRRSGLGKLSSHAWERRRIVLRGSCVEYFKTEKEERVEDPLGLLLDEGKLPDEGKQTKASWLETAAANLEKAKANVNSSIAMLTNPSDNLDPNAPRGALDLIKERATVAAATGHSGAPTPFAISIKVRGETKWKICHDSHAEQMEWLVALTDVVVLCSVDSYNAQLLLLADPTHHEIATGMFGIVVYRPPDEIDGTPAGGGHRLWETQEYRVSSRKDQVEDDPEESEVEEDSEVDDENIPVTEIQSKEITLTKSLPGLSPPDEHSSTTTAEVRIVPIITIQDKDFYICVVIINVAMIFSHASSTTTSNFWYIVTFANLGLWMLLAKEWKGKTSQQMARLGSPTPMVATPVIISLITEPNATTIGKKKGTAKIEAFTSVESTQRSVSPTFKPNAGSTTIEIVNHTDVPQKDGLIFAAWRKPEPDLMIRSHGYMSNGKKKVPSPGTLYEVVCSDIFESRNRYPDMAPRVHLPEVKFDDDVRQKTWRAPDLFVVSVSLPTDPPKLTKATEDGGGYTITIYMVMTQETRDILKRITADGYDPSSECPLGDIQKSKVNAVKLFEEWCRRAPSDPKFMSRFKLVPNAQNLNEIGLPAWIAKYNGKPVLIKRPGQTGFLYPHPELSCIEFDISLHPFPYLAKQAICYMKENFFKKVLVTFGFVIEGRADDELPECLIGLMQLCYPDPLYAIQAEDVFAGTSAQSR